MTAALAKLDLEDNTPIRMWILSGIYATLVSKTPTTTHTTTTIPTKLAATQHATPNTDSTSHSNKHQTHTTTLPRLTNLS